MWEPAAPANDHTHSRRNDYIAAWWRTTDVLYHNDHKERNNVLLRVAKRNARKRDTSPRTELQLTSSSSSRHCIQEMQSKRDSSHLLILHLHVRRRVRFGRAGQDGATADRSVRRPRTPLILREVRVLLHLFHLLGVVNLTKYNIPETA